MKAKLHYLFYAAAAVSLVGSWLRWPWIVGQFDGYFAAFCLVTAELIRVKQGLKSGIVEKINSTAQRIMLVGIPAAMIMFSLAIGYYLKVHLPAESEKSKEMFRQEFFEYQAHKIEEERKAKEGAPQ